MVSIFRLFSAALYLCAAQLVHCSGPASHETELLKRAEANVRLGHLEAALAECQTALKDDPHSAWAHYLSGVVYSLLGDSQKARESAKNALGIDPSLLTAHLLLGRIDIQSGLFDDAVTEFQTVVAAGDDKEANGRYGLGLALLNQGKYEDAYGHLEAAADRKVNDPARLYALISTQLELNRGDVKERLVQFEGASPQANFPAPQFSLKARAHRRCPQPTWPAYTLHWRSCALTEKTISRLLRLLKKFRPRSFP